MAKISTYQNDNIISLEDKVIGTDAEDSNITKNYAVGDLLLFIKENLPISPTGKVNYINSVDGLRLLTGNELGDVAITKSYYGDNKEGGNNYVLVSLNSSGYTDDGGLTIIGYNDYVWKSLNIEYRFNITRFGVRTDGTDQTVNTQAAIDAKIPLSLPTGLVTIEGTLEFYYRTDILGAGKQSGFHFIFPDNSSLTGLMLCAGIQLADMVINITASGYTGDFALFNSEFMELRYNEAGGGTVATRAHDTKLNNVMFFKEQPYEDWTGTCIKWHHTGKGKADYGAIFDQINIIGDFEWAVDILAEQQYADTEPDVSTPWWTGQTYSQMLINKCAGGYRVGTANPAGNPTQIPLSPSYFVYDGNQMQCERDESTRMFHFTNAANQKVTDCHPWDWHVAHVDYVGKPYQISNYSGEDYGTFNIIIKDSLSTGQSLVHDAGMPPRAYENTVMTNAPSYGGANNFSVIEGSGTDGKYTYRDLMQLAPGIYGAGQDRNLSKDLGIDTGLLNTSKTAIMSLEVTKNYQNRTVFTARRHKVTTLGADLGKMEASIWYAAFPLTFLEADNATWMDADIDYSWWSNALGDSPDDYYYCRSEQRSTSPRAGFTYFDTRILKSVSWNENLSIWVDPTGAQCIGTEIEYETLNPKPSRYYDETNDSILTYEEYYATTVTSIDELRNLTGSQIGDVVSVNSYYNGLGVGGGDFVTINDLAEKQIYFDTALTQKIDTTGLSGSVLAAETVWITFKLDSFSGNNGYIMSTSGASQTRIQLVSSTVGDYGCSTVGYGTLESIKDFNGNDTPSNNLILGTWYTISVNPLIDTNITSIKVGMPFGSEDNNIYVSSFGVGSETFYCQEGSGIIVTGDEGTILDLLNTPDWSTVNYDNGFDLIQNSEGQLYRKLIVNEAVNFYEFGAINTKSLTDYSQDSYSQIQAAFDSEYTVEQNGGKFYISQGLIQRVQKEVRLSGRLIQITGYDDDTFSNDTTSTFIYSDQNIDYWRIQSSSGSVKGGILYTANSSNHTKSGFVFDPNFEIWGFKLIDITVFGNRDELLTTGVGTLGVHLETTGITKYGYFEQIQVTGVAAWCAVGYKNEQFNQSDKDTFGSWQNNHTVYMPNLGCKQFYVIGVGSVSIRGLQQAFAVRNLTESTLIGVDVSSTTNEVDASIIDGDTKADEITAGKYRFDQYRYKIQVKTAFDLGKSVKDNFLKGTMDTEMALPSTYNFVHNPKGSYIQSYQTMISDNSNSIRYIQDEAGHVEMKGFEATNLSWFENNLLQAEDPLNTTPLTVSADVTVNNPERFLTSGENPTVNYSINQLSELHFLEIHIKDIHTFRDIGDSKIQQLFFAARYQFFTQIQFIVKFDAGTWDRIVPIQDADNSNFKSFFSDNTAPLGWSDYANDHVRDITIRLIGCTLIDEVNPLYEVALQTQFYRNLPSIQNSGTQTIYATLRTKGNELLSSVGDKLLEIKESVVANFGAYIGGVDDESNLVNIGVAGSNLFLGSNEILIKADNAIPNGFLKLSETPTVVGGEDYYPLSFQTLVTETGSEVFTSVSNVPLGVAYSAILTSTALVNSYDSPANFSWEFQLANSDNKSHVVTYRALVNAVPTGSEKNITIGSGQTIIINGESDIVTPISAGAVITLEALADSSGDMTVVGSETTTRMKLSQLSTTLGASPSMNISGGSVSYKIIGSKLIVELSTGSVFTIPEISTLSSTNFDIKLKNVSGGTVTVNTSGSDTIEGNTSITLIDGESVEMYISTATEFKL